MAMGSKTSRTGINATGKSRANRGFTLRSGQIDGEKRKFIEQIGEPQNRNERRALKAMKKGQRKQKRRLADMDCSNLVIKGRDV